MEVWMANRVSKFNILFIDSKFKVYESRTSSERDERRKRGTYLLIFAVASPQKRTLLRARKHFIHSYVCVDVRPSRPDSSMCSKLDCSIRAEMETSRAIMSVPIVSSTRVLDDPNIPDYARPAHYIRSYIYIVEYLSPSLKSSTGKMM